MYLCSIVVLNGIIYLKVKIGIQFPEFLFKLKEILLKDRRFEMSNPFRHLKKK